MKKNNILDIISAVVNKYVYKYVFQQIFFHVIRRYCYMLCYVLFYGKSRFCIVWYSLCLIRHRRQAITEHSSAVFPNPGLRDPQAVHVYARREQENGLWVLTDRFRNTGVVKMGRRRKGVDGKTGRWEEAVIMWEAATGHSKWTMIYRCTTAEVTQSQNDKQNPD